MSDEPMDVRIAPLEWSVRAAAGELHGLGWVDAALVDSGRSFVQADGRFRHVPYGAFLPAPMVRAAAAAAANGEPTALEGVLLVFARAEWLVRTRRWWFAAWSPVPALLAPLVESYGIPSELHRGSPARLASLLAHLPRWWPHRGRLDRAMALLRSAGLGFSETPGPGPSRRPAGSERFACHGAGWWAARRADRPSAPSSLVIREDGVVAFARVDASAVAEDAAIEDRGTGSVPVELLRLLPVWTSPRLKEPESP